MRTLLEKTPFFLLALLFGVVALFSQAGALRSSDGLHFWDNLLVACHGLLFYLAKAIVPINLSALYLVPSHPNGRLPLAFFVAPLFVLGLAALLARYGRRSKTLVFTCLFFLITLLPVLQIVPIGSAAAADRYFYLPSFGLCFAAGKAFSRLEVTNTGHRSWRGILVPLAGVVLLLVFAGIARERIPIWRNSFSLWNDVLAKDPDSYVAFGYRGMAHAAAGSYEPAMADFQRALALGGNRRFIAEIYYNRGALQQQRGQLAAALTDYDHALAIDPESVRVLINRGNVLDASGRPEEALKDYTFGLTLEPENPLLSYNRGLTHHRTGNVPQAVLDYSEALKRDPWFTPAYEHRSKAFVVLGDLRRAQQDRDRARSLTEARDGRKEATLP